MNNKYVIKMNYPCNWWKARWREAIPLGNGITGASVYGAVWDETIMITHTDLWWKSETPDLPDVSGTIPEIRKKLLNRQVAEADRIMVDALVEKGYDPVLGCPLPLCDLRIVMDAKHGFKQYERTLDMLTGEANVSWNAGESRFSRKCFVSYDKDVLVMEIQEENKKPFGTDVYLDVHDLEDAKWYHEDMEEFLPAERVFHVSEDGILSYTALNDDNTYFGAVAKVVTDGDMSVNDDRKLTLSNATKVTIVLKSFVKSRTTEPVKDISNQLENIKMDYDSLFEEHRCQWDCAFSTSRLELDCDSEGTCNEQLLLDAYQGEASLELINKMWLYGKYLLLAASREGGNPCHLYGLWCGEYLGHWSFNMVNENLQMIYWQALSGNSPQLLLPVFDYIDKLMDDFRQNAKKLYGCRGIFIPGPTVPDSGLIKNVSSHLLYWTGGAGWVGQHYYDYYLCTQDVKFLKERAIPYLKEVALFYEDFLVENEEGYYMTIPSNSPENSPGNCWNYKSGMDVGMETTMNATMDFAIIKEVLTHLIEGCKICNVEQENIEKWTNMLGKIPPYELNEDGAIKEWMHPFFDDNYKHRHQSHLYPLFPGNEIHEETDPELYKAFLLAAKKRLEVGINQQTGWSMAHLSNNYARMKEGELALECLDLMCRSCVMNNLMTVHNDWRHMGVGLNMEWSTVQLDANMGLTAAINEMLMQSYDNTILILPALPKRFVSGRVEQLLSRQGILVSIAWDLNDNCVTVRLKNDKGNKQVALKLPDGYICQQLDSEETLLNIGDTEIILNFIKQR